MQDEDIEPDDLEGGSHPCGEGLLFSGRLPAAEAQGYLTYSDRRGGGGTPPESCKDGGLGTVAT